MQWTESLQAVIAFLINNTTPEQLQALLPDNQATPQGPRGHRRNNSADSDISVQSDGEFAVVERVPPLSGARWGSDRSNLSIPDGIQDISAAAGVDSREVMTPKVGVQIKALKRCCSCRAEGFKAQAIRLLKARDRGIPKAAEWKRRRTGLCPLLLCAPADRACLPVPGQPTPSFSSFFLAQGSPINSMDSKHCPPGCFNFRRPNPYAQATPGANSKVPPPSSLAPVLPWPSNPPTTLASPPPLALPHPLWRLSPCACSALSRTPPSSM